MRSILIFVFSVQAFPQELPRIGWYADLAGDIRALSGVSGSFLPGAVELSGARSLTASDVLAIASVEGGLVAIERGRELAFLAGAGLVAVHGNRAIAWLAERGAWAMYADGDWRMVTYAAPPPGIERLAWDGGGAYHAATRDRLLEIRLQDGAILESRDLDAAPLAILDGGGVVLAEASELRISLRGGSEQRVALGSSPVRVDSINREWLCIRLADERLQLVRLRPPVARIFELPATPAGEVPR
ncbi:MAG: hypothetical protein K2X35_05315 [Bryobacteraceae bacterium]|nr:hypothetical protein [Bryobacteraceae bacterium]